MLASTIAVAALCGSVVSAHSPIQARDHRPIIQARQGTGSSSSSSTRAPTATGTPTGTGAPTATGTVSTAPTGTALPVPIVTAPGAIPLASILPDPATGPPTPTLTTPAAGATPHGLTGAPALPNLQGWNGVANYPPWDKAPPTDTDQVIEWIQQVRDSGVVIPDIKPRTNNPNGLCADPANAPRVGNTQECWWSCGRCTRSTDIVQCPTAKVWGSSLDDGPAPYSPLLLDYFAQNQISSTFFVVGSRVAQRPAYLQAEYIAGHTIGVHTWSHTPLTTQSSEQVIAELGWTKKVIKDAIGVTPKYFRPPYGDIDDRVRAIGRAMNMTAVMWSTTGAVGSEVSFDTFDYNVPGGEKTAEQSVAQFSSLLHIAETYGSGFIVLAHDLWWQQVELSKSYFFPTALSLRYKVTSINDCMNQQLKDVYVETAGSTALPPGSGIGGQVTGTGQTAPKNAPLGGSDGTNSDPNVKAGAGNGGGGGDAAPARMDTSMITAFAGVVLAAGLSMASAL